MKFLITGSVRSSKGPRLIVAWTLAGFAIYFAAHWFREWSAFGFFPADLVRSIRGDGADAGRSATLLLEDLHVDLLSYSVLLMFLGALFFQTGHSLAFKKGLFLTCAAACLGYVLAKGAIALRPEFALPAFLAGLVFLVAALLLFVLIARFLFSPDENL